MAHTTLPVKKKQRKKIGADIKEAKAAGKKTPQAVAIALSKSRKRGASTVKTAAKRKKK
jgi:hypothetical protein